MELSLNKSLIIKRVVGSIEYNKYLDKEVNYKGKREEIVDEDIIEFIAIKILKKAIEYTPVDTGKLVDSVYMRKYRDGYEIGYDAEYATYVHEVGTNFHQIPTQYKFLEDAAYEVISEYLSDTGNFINVNIIYYPLKVYIGEKDTPGESLIEIKKKEKLTKNEHTYKKLLNEFLSYNIKESSESDKIYYNKMKEFFEYYRTSRHFSDWEIIEEWVDRNRHK